MADRLIPLFELLSGKVREIDALMKAPGGRDERALEHAWQGLLEIVAQQKQMVDEIARRSQELSSLSAFLQTHYEREKASLARELHDQLGGILTPAKMDLAWLQSSLGDDPRYTERMARLNALIDQGIDLKRRIIEDLRPSLLDHLGFGAAVQWLVDETCGAARIHSRVTISKLERLSPDLEIALYRIVQESVANVIRHAAAKNLDLTVERTAQGLRVAVCDDGIGIDDLDHARKASHGLAGMTQRMRAINGTLEISSRKGKGTKVEAFLPIAA
jgi:signal transduction histidine kinase